MPDQVIAHRGASAYAPENTLAAFNLALTMGCDFIEFDVMLSADEQPFVFHDDHLQRTSNGRGAFALMKADQIQSLDAGSWFGKRYCGEKIPPLREVLQWLIAANVRANLEIKPCPGTTEQTTIAVLSHLNRYWPQDRLLPLVSSFDGKALQLCRSLAPEMPLGLLLDGWDELWLQKASDLQCYSVHINRRALNAARVKDIKDQGFKLFVYTVNSKRQAKKLLEWGVDAVFSDYPDLLS